MSEKINIYRSKSDLKNLNNDGNESIKFHNLLSIVFLINETRNFKSEIELISSTENFIKIKSEKLIDYQKLKEIVETGYSPFFSRGDFEYYDTKKIYKFKIKQFLKNKGNKIEIDIMDKKSSIKELSIYGINSSDIQEIQKINSDDINLQTHLGNNSFVGSEISIKHTDENQIIKNKSRRKIWCEGNTPDLQSDIFEENNNGIIISTIFSFSAKKDFFFIFNNHVIYWSFSEYIREKTSSLIKSFLKPRIKNSLRMFMEVDISGLKLSDYEENLSKKQKSKIFEDNIKTLMTKILKSEKFQKYIEKVEEHFIQQEDMSLQERIKKINSRPTILYNNQFLYKVPVDEQNVIALSMLLSRLKVFDTFEFLNFSSRGIDSIANFKIDQSSQTQKNQVVEFKYVMESFKDERHPINLVNYIICWKMNKERLQSGDKFKVEIMGAKKGIYNIKHLKTGHSAIGIVIKEVISNNKAFNIR